MAVFVARPLASRWRRLMRPGEVRTSLRVAFANRNAGVAGAATSPSLGVVAPCDVLTGASSSRRRSAIAPIASTATSPTPIRSIRREAREDVRSFAKAYPEGAFSAGMSLGKT